MGKASPSQVKHLRLSPRSKYPLPLPLKSPLSQPTKIRFSKVLHSSFLTLTSGLQLFSFAGYLTTIAFLAGTGFNQLYLQRSTFGADGLRDYFALLAWGFGAEATRSAVTNALRRTDESKP